MFAIVKILPIATFFAGAIAVAAISLAASVWAGPAFIQKIERAAIVARDKEGGAGITISFVTAGGWLTRHPTLSGGRGLNDNVRARTAAAIADVPGIGGVSWEGRGRRNGNAVQTFGEGPLQRCQSDVEAILRVRSIRFTEGSANLDQTSNDVLNEVATALKPCLGSIIAITGHTDSNGDENANVALSRARAEAVRWALIGRGIPADGLRAVGIGSQKPLDGLSSDDPANRRIEFSVIEKMPLAPTPIDTPGPG